MFDKLDLKGIINQIGVIDTQKFKISSKKDRKKSQRKITRLIREYGIRSTHHEYERAIGNGMAHGKCPVKCKIHIGQHGQMVCVIKDAGNGFDYKEVVRKFAQHEVYYHNHGFGTRCYARNEHLHVDWKDQGRTIILFYDGH
jgi:hypothetical protein